MSGIKGTVWFLLKCESVVRYNSKLWWIRLAIFVVACSGLVLLMFSPVLGQRSSDYLWAIEPIAYIATVLMLTSLLLMCLSYYIPRILGRSVESVNIEKRTTEKWGLLTQQYFELFHHDLGRPLRRILGKERELQLTFRAAKTEIHPEVQGLLDEIEVQTPSFRLMVSNIQVLVQLELPTVPTIQPVEPSQLIRRIVDRYTPLAAEASKEITWWSEPAEFGLVYSDGAAIEHILTNLVDNTVRYADEHIEIQLTKNLTDFFIRVWDDGPGIAPYYTQHIFDRGWTPEVARIEEKTSSGLGLFIASTLAKKYGGDLTVESVVEPDRHHHTAFLLSLPIKGPS